METGATNNLFQDFLDKLKNYNIENLKSEEKIHVNELAGNVYYFYEKARNLIEYKEQHLFRRSAIERFLKRKFLLNTSNLENLSEELFRELIKTRYLANNSLSVDLIEEVGVILNKYLLIYSNFTDTRKGNLKSLLAIASVEIESLIWPNKEEEFYLDFVYNSYIENIDCTEKIENKEIIYASTYFAVHRFLWKSDMATIKYYLLKNIFTEWNTSINPEEITEVYLNFESFFEKLNDNEIYFRIQRLVRKNIAPYKVLRKAIFNDKVLDKIDDQKLFLQKVNQTLHGEYLLIKEKTQRRIIQSIIYIFITKIFLAIILELPYDLMVEGHLSILPLAVNLTFPPAFMFLLGTLITSPGVSNTKEINRRIEALVFGGSEVKYLIKKKKEHKVGNFFFNFFYLLTVLLSFFLVLLVLEGLEFNLMSGLVFFVFFSTVSFFGYRVSQTAKELLVIEEKRTIRGVLADFILLPFIKAGQWLSDKYSNINIFIFVFDYIIEIPLKGFLSIFENWSSFISGKKEDMLD